MTGRKPFAEISCLLARSTTYRASPTDRPDATDAPGQPDSLPAMPHVTNPRRTMDTLTGLAWLLLCQSARQALAGMLRLPAVRKTVAACSDALL